MQQGQHQPTEPEGPPGFHLLLEEQGWEGLVSTLESVYSKNCGYLSLNGYLLHSRILSASCYIGLTGLSLVII